MIRGARLTALFALNLNSNTVPSLCSCGPGRRFRVVLGAVSRFAHNMASPIPVVDTAIFCTTHLPAFLLEIVTPCLLSFPLVQFHLCILESRIHYYTINNENLLLHTRRCRDLVGGFAICERFCPYASINAKPITSKTNEQCR